MSENVIFETATATCPALEIDLTADIDTTYDGLDATLKAYSDGYKAALKLTMATTYHTAMVGNSYTDASTLVGVDMEAAATATKGAWLVDQAYTTSSGDAYSTALNFIPFTVTAVAASDALAVACNTDQPEKYGTATQVDNPAANMAAGGTSTTTFYMPSEPSSEPETGESSALVGDRLDKGDRLFAWNGLGTSAPLATSACNDDEKGQKLKLGAATLVAGSVAFAAALAF